MAKTKLDLYSKTDEAFHQFAKIHHQNLTGNPVFASPVPSADDFGNLLEGFITTIDNVQKAEDAKEEAVALKNQARELLTAALIQRGNYVDTASAGDPAKILAAGFDVADTNRAASDLPAPENLTASIGDGAGELDLSWDAVLRARAYIVEIRLNDESLPWQQAAVATRSRVTVRNLQTGKIYAARVKAVGAKGDSPWSIVVNKVVA